MKLPLTSSTYTALLLAGLGAGTVILSSSLGLATAPPGHFTIANGTAEATVTDNATSLMWMRKPAATAMHWDEAVTYCTDLSFSGYTDWRLPTVKELATIVDDSRVSPAVDTDAFPAIPASGTFWSSSSLPWNSEAVGVLDIGSGSSGTQNPYNSTSTDPQSGEPVTVTVNPKTAYTQYVLCARDAP